MSQTPKSRKKQPKKKRYAAQNYLILTFGFCWLMGFGFYVFDLSLRSVPGFIMSVVYMFVPALIVLLVYNNKTTEFLPLSLAPSVWFLVAVLMPVGLAAASFGVSLLFEGVSFSPDMAGLAQQMGPNLTPEQIAEAQAKVPPFWMIALQALIGGMTINTIFAMGEELGWRGLLLKEWKAWGFWGSSLAIGLAWGVWHLPLILMGHNYPQNPAIGVLMMTLWCMGLSPLIQWVRIKANSVAAAALFHGMINGVAGLSTVYLSGASELVGGLLGAAGMLVLGASNLMLYFWLKARPVTWT
ncbi:MAG: CPBP family intramembrane glutamic endopeptidase [bacterium]|nr:CPBP family intramembrane glutamic endopeptidase [bacterium]